MRSGWWVETTGTGKVAVIQAARWEGLEKIRWFRPVIEFVHARGWRRDERGHLIRVMSGAEALILTRRIPGTASRLGDAPLPRAVRDAGDWDEARRRYRVWPEAAGEWRQRSKWAKARKCHHIHGRDPWGKIVGRRT